MRWDVSVIEAAKIQNELRSKIRIEKLEKKPGLIAGVDVSSNRFSNTLYAGFVVLTFPALEEVERACATFETTFPYVPGYLSFREIPALLKAFEKLTMKPDVVCVDGQGIAHPRRMGIAAHLGLALDIPSVGFAKSILYGHAGEPKLTSGSIEYLRDPKTNEIIGAKVRTKAKCKPMVVSPGHRTSVDDAIELCLATTRLPAGKAGGYRIPEPTRLAHEAVNQFRKSFM